MNHSGTEFLTFGHKDILFNQLKEDEETQICFTYRLAGYMDMDASQKWMKAALLSYSWVALVDSGGSYSICDHLFSMKEKMIRGKNIYGLLGSCQWTGQCEKPGRKKDKIRNNKFWYKGI